METRRIHLDNAATTRTLFATPAPFGNPSSLHADGREARRALDDARERIAGRLGRDPREVIFTSGATEANNLAILGAPPGHMVTTAIEHPSVLEAASRRGDVTVVPVDATGRVRAEDVIAAVRPGTVLVSVMLVNNETGVIQPVREIASAVKGALMHCDAAQGAGKLPLDLPVDLMTLSAHKIHGPKGAAALIAKRGVKLEPRQAGGAQEFGRRAGTENVAGAMGLAEALDRAEFEATGPLRDRLEAALEDVEVNGTGPRVPNIANLSFAGVDGEAMMIALDRAGVNVSTGAACASLAQRPSHVLRAMGLSEERVLGSIRFSLGMDTTAEEIDRAIAIARAEARRLEVRA